jgi:GTP:adenosylcobinamide-phosphate guanylyltransferase
MAELGILDMVFASLAVRSTNGPAPPAVPPFRRSGLDESAPRVKGRPRMALPPVTVIVLAGQRAGAVNPLAARAEVSHKCLAPIRGKALIAHVLETMTALPSVAEIRVSVEADAHAELAPVIEAYQGRSAPIHLVPSRPKLIDSVIAAAGDDEGPFLITTADNVLVSETATAQVRTGMADPAVDAVFSMARREAVLAAHPEGQRNFYRFRDGEYANCNLYGLANRKTFPVAAHVYAGGGQFMKSVKRMIDAFGLGNIVLLRLGLFDLAGALRRFSRRSGIVVKPTVLADGAQAIDVDNERTYRVCEELLARREAA